MENQPKRTFLVRHYPTQQDTNRRYLNTGQFQEPVIDRVTVGQWQAVHPGYDVRAYLVSTDLSADYDDAIALANEIAEAAGREWDAREDLKTEALEWLLEAASQLRTMVGQARETFMQIPNLSKNMGAQGLAIADVVTHFLM